MNKLRVLIVDDEPLAHKVIEGYCEKIDYIEIAGNCYDGISTLNFLNKEMVDAILLDIQMPDITGIELLDSLKQDAPKVIFTTAYTEYAMISFDYDQVIDYLHKPIRITRFIKAIERLKKVLILENDFQQSSAQEAKEPVEKVQKDFITLKDNKTLHHVKLVDIRYIQSWGNYLKIFLANDDIKIVRKTIKVIEEELPQQSFIRIHKSYIVNINSIKSLIGNQIQISDQKLPIGKSYALMVKKRMT